jgi:hypothetical protein
MRARDGDGDEDLRVLAFRERQAGEQMRAWMRAWRAIATTRCVAFTFTFFLKPGCICS